MLKVRLMGTKQDIKSFGKFIRNNRKYEILNYSELYPNKGSEKYYRVYVQLSKPGKKEEN